MSSISKKSFKHHNNTDFFKSKFKILLLKQPLLASLLMVMCSPQLSFSQPQKVASTPLKSYLYPEQPTKQNQQALATETPLPIEGR